MTIGPLPKANGDHSHLQRPEAQTIRSMLLGIDWIYQQCFHVYLNNQAKPD
jgi:hypothetical protein